MRGPACRRRGPRGIREPRRDRLWARATYPAPMLGWLTRWRAHPPVPMVLYTRPGCHLCEEMKREIARARLRRPYSLTEVDIDSDPALAAEHGQSIPVLTIGGRKAFKARLNAAELERKFERLAAEHERAAELARALEGEG